MSNRPSLDLDNEELATLKVALESFITSDFENMHPLEKKKENTLARSALRKISNELFTFNGEDLSIAHFALELFYSVLIEDISNSARFVDPDAGNYLKVTSRLLSSFEEILNSAE